MIDYYRSVAPFILPYLSGRPESLRRNPDGIAGESFFQKNVEGKVPDWVETVKVRADNGSEETTYLVCSDEASLVYMANLGCIEINPWHSRTGSLEQPDYMVLDLDPLEIDFAEVVRTARETEDVLAMIGARGIARPPGRRACTYTCPSARATRTGRPRSSRASSTSWYSAACRKRQAWSASPGSGAERYTSITSRTAEARH